MTLKLPVKIEALGMIKKETEKLVNKMRGFIWWYMKYKKQIVLGGTDHLLREVKSMWFESNSQKRQQKHRYTEYI